MDCSQARELLSAYCDDELSAEERATVALHLEQCEDCARRLEEFHRLSRLAQELVCPSTPDHLWPQFEQQLDAANGQGGSIGGSRPRWQICTAAVAASVLLVALVWIAFKSWPGHDGHEMGAAFEQYLTTFSDDPETAQHILVENYPSREVELDQAIEVVGYRPAIADGLPDGITAGPAYVLKMPCCTCVQCYCQRPDRSGIAIFEHDDDESDWFGDRSESAAICHGTRCSLVNLSNNLLAATWRRGQRFITVVGARDMSEIERLVASLQRSDLPRKQ